MKTIEDAVIELDGKLPNRTYTKYSNAVGWYISRCGKLTHAVDCVWFEPDQFQAEAKRMGYINGYRYGVEYPTNGKRPELPDDVIVEPEADMLHCAFTPEPVSFYNWSQIKAFCIVDPRYKPVDEVSETERLGIQPPMNKNERCSMQEQNNSWHERGELPPVGCDDFEWSLNGKCWEHGLMLFNDGTTCLIANKKYPANRHHLKSFDPDLSFRPIKTHREKVIEAALAVAEKDCPECGVKILRSLYAAGMLVLPQDSGNTKD